MQEILFPVGRLVSGHPMENRAVTDKENKQMLNATGQPITERYVGVAIPKGSEQHWNQTEWGAKIWQAAQDPTNGYPNGEFNAPTFSWKITDGDSQVPNKKGNKPADQEGYPAHWVIHLTTRIAYNCFHVGRYDPMQAIQRKEEIKRGDYCRVFATVKGNKPSQSPGVYINPTLFELSRAGVEIVSQGSGPAAADVFGGNAPVLPQNAQLDQNAQAPAPVSAPTVNAPPPPPAHDLLTPPAPPVAPVEERYNVNGAVYTKSQLLAMPGWTEAHLTTLPRA